MKTLLVLAAAFATFRLIRPLLVLNQLLRVRVRKQQWRAVAEEEVPVHARDGLRGAIAELKALGFTLAGWAAVEREGARGLLPLFHARLFHVEVGAHATAAFSSAPDPVVPWIVTFSTWSEDGRVLRTFGGGERSFLGEPAGTIAVTPYALTVALQWETHLRSVHAANIVPTRVDPERAFALSRDAPREFFDSLVRDRLLLPASESTFMASWPLALRATRVVLPDAAACQKQRTQRSQMLRSLLQPLPMVPIEEEVAAYERLVEYTGGPPRPSFLAALFVVTVPLFFVASWYATGIATTAVTVLAVVLFHELGHYTAMRRLGYVDTTIFFVPFLGGIASGRKDEATLTQRMVVLLAGPLPGLLLAIALTRVDLASAPWLHSAVPLLALINLFNLLPILPLDGGQIAHMLFFARRPWLDVSARAVAGVGLLAIGWAASGTFLAVLGVLTLVQLPKARRQAELRRQVADARRAWPAEPAVRLVFRALQASPLAGVPFAQKIGLVRATLAQATLSSPVRPRALFGWLCAYGAVVMVGCVGFVLSIDKSATAQTKPRGAPRVEAVAALGCPEPERAGLEPDATTTDAFFAGVGMFDTPDALAAAQARVAAAAPGAEFRSLGPALFAWTPAEYSDDDSFGTVDTARKRRAADAVTSAGGRFFDASAATASVACTARDEAAASSIDDALETSFVAARGGIWIPAPWSAAAAPTDEQQRARQTFRVVMAAQWASRTTRPRPSLWSLLTQRGHANVDAYRAQEVRAVETAVADERAKHPVDPDVVSLVIQRIESQSPAERNRLEGQLRERLGAAGPSDVKDSPSALTVSRTGPRLHIALGYLRPRHIDSAIRPMMRWLCAQSCVDAALVIETR